jgi:hypothetical protein
MSHELTLTKEVVVVAIFVVLVIIVAVILKRRPRTLNPQYFKSKWQELQGQCASKATWSLAVIDADKLLDEALKKKHFKGKNMGERLVAAQHTLTDNDGVWFGHKLRNRLVHEQAVQLTQTAVKQALRGIRQALKDLEAL